MKLKEHEIASEVRELRCKNALPAVMERSSAAFASAPLLQVMERSRGRKGIPAQQR